MTSGESLSIAAFCEVAAVVLICIGHLGWAIVFLALAAYFLLGPRLPAP